MLQAGSHSLHNWQTRTCGLACSAHNTAAAGRSVVLSVSGRHTSRDSSTNVQCDDLASNSLECGWATHGCPECKIGLIWSINKACMYIVCSCVLDSFKPKVNVVCATFRNITLQIFRSNMDKIFFNPSYLPWNCLLFYVCCIKRTRLWKFWKFFTWSDAMVLVVLSYFTTNSWGLQLICCVFCP